MNAKFQAMTPEHSTEIKTLCAGCQAPISCEWPREMSWAGNAVTPEEYMANSLKNDSTGVYCDFCLEKMPDVNLWNIHVSCPACKGEDVARYKKGDSYEYVCQSCNLKS